MTAQPGTASTTSPVTPPPDSSQVTTTVLIVDDHPTFRATARMLLEAEGYDVVGEAPDGQSGIDQARSLGPDVVLLDVNLPDLDGFAVAERITAFDGAPAVVLVSSRDPRTSARSCAAAGPAASSPRASSRARRSRRLLRVTACAGMLALRRALLALLALGVVFAGLDVAIILISRHEAHKLATALLGVAVGLSLHRRRASPRGGGGR